MKIDATKMADDIVHWNINGLKSKQSINYNTKIEKIKSILDNKNTLLINIQETHLFSENEIPQYLHYYTHIFHFENAFANKNDPSSGILLGIRKSEDIIETKTIEEGRLIYIKLKNKASSEITNLFSIYCKAGNAEKQKKIDLKIGKRN